MSEALEIVLRYLVAAGAGWLVQHGLNESFASPDLIQAVATIIGGIALWLMVLCRALVMSTVAKVMDRMKRRHPVDLVEGASQVDGVHVIHADAVLADAIPGPKVVAP